MVRWKLKSCPRCGGDMLIDMDLDRWYEQCLQCSYRTDLQPLKEFKDPVATDESGKGEDTVEEEESLKGC